MVEGKDGAIARGMRGRHHLILDMTGANGAKMQQFAEEAHKRGYDIHMVAIRFPSWKSMGRAARRFMNNPFGMNPTGKDGQHKELGRYVPPGYAHEKVDGKPDKTYDQLKQHPAISSWTQVSTEGDEPQVIDRGSKERGATGGQYRRAEVAERYAHFDPNEARDAAGKWTGHEGGGDGESQPMTKEQWLALSPDERYEAKKGLTQDEQDRLTHFEIQAREDAQQKAKQERHKKIEKKIESLVKAGDTKIKETAFRVGKKVYLSGPFHNIALVPGGYSQNVVAGFITHGGVFLDRDEAGMLVEGAPKVTTSESLAEDDRRESVRSKRKG